MEINKSEEKPAIKKQRMLTYFVQAAMEIIQREGVENISVRKLADAAGYSYATIYNYFCDLDDLLLTVKGVMVKELADKLTAKMEGIPKDVEGLIKIFQTYMEFYYENPNVFRFFFFTPIPYPNKSEEGSESEPNFNLMWSETLLQVVKEGKLKKEDMECFIKTVIYTMHGMLTLNLSGNGELTKEEAKRDLEKVIRYLLKTA